MSDRVRQLLASYDALPDPDKRAAVEEILRRATGAGRDRPRPFGLCAGTFAVPDDFDAPLPEDVLRGFEGR
jgi:hypothetical protein